MKKNKFYITTAIDYVNAKPHIGHALEKVQADVLARYHRLLNEEVFFSIGTDEHGVKIVRAAAEAKRPVVKFVDANTAAYKDMARVLNISNDYFIRTTNKKLHWPATRKVWNTLVKNGDIYKKEYQGLYCVGHEAFVTKKDLKNGKCVLHGREPEIIEEENYFFKLSRYTRDIKRAIKKGEFKILPRERKNEVLKFLEKGLEDVSFSRPRKDLKWGIPVPKDPTQTIYVWADALTNYLSVLGWGAGKSSKFNKFWPPDVQIIGKDILRFHAIIWPAMLLSLKLPLPRVLFAHGFIGVDGQKMSKSLGNVIDPFEFIKKYGVDALRYYLLAEIPSYKDGDISTEKFEARYNGDLALGLGNFLARIVGLGEKHLDKPLTSKLSSRSKTEVDKRWHAYHVAMDNFKFNEAIREAQALVAYGDKRINAIKLWELVEDKDKFEREISDLATILGNVAHMFAPFIPQASEEIFKQLGINAYAQKSWIFKMKKIGQLFPRLK